tara:strand:- start:207 stop:503 length:297 start_codon:yes stop_codon:yes gene_type:complete
MPYRVWQPVPVSKKKWHATIRGVMAKTPRGRVAIPFLASVFCSHSERRFLKCVEMVRLNATFLMGKYAGFYEVTFFSEPIPCTSVLFGGVYIHIAFAL